MDCSGGRSTHPQEGYFCDCCSRCEINTDILLQWAHKGCVTALHTLSYFLYSIIVYKLTVKRRNSRVKYVWAPCLARLVNSLEMKSQSIEQCIMKSGNCDASLWQVIVSSLYIDHYWWRYPRPVLQQLIIHILPLVLLYHMHCQSVLKQASVVSSTTITTMYRFRGDLAQRGLMLHIYVSLNWITITSGNGFILTSLEFLSILPLRTTFNDILVNMKYFRSTNFIIDVIGSKSWQGLGMLMG